MKKIIYTSFSPNTRAKDLFLNVSLLLQPWNTLRGPNARLVEQAFEDKFNAKAFTFNYARSGMYVLFKSLDLPTNSDVLVQGFTCSAATNPIKWAGLNPVYVDVDKETANLSAKDLANKLTPNSKVVMFQHTFGNSTGLDEVVEFCKSNNLILIEDCTNTVFGLHKDKLIGSFGDASIFSFGRDKAISGVNGGLILINNKSLLENFEKNLTKNYPKFIWAYKELLYPIIWYFIKLFFNVKLGKLIHLAATKTNLINNATTNAEKLGKKPACIPAKLPNSLAKLALAQLKDIENLNKHRASIAFIYKQNLQYITKIKVLDFEAGNIPLRLPVLVENREKLVNFLKTNNIYVGDWYSQPIVPLNVSLEEYGYQPGTCPNADSMCKQIINLPLHINTTKNDAEYVSKLIKQFYEN